MTGQLQSEVAKLSTEAHKHYRYLRDDLQLLPNEALPIARNWARSPQTMDEVRQGVLAERERREASYDEAMRLQGNPNKIGC
jgi:hypothetical protein